MAANSFGAGADLSPPVEHQQLEQNSEMSNPFQDHL